LTSSYRQDINVNDCAKTLIYGGTTHTPPTKGIAALKPIHMLLLTVLTIACLPTQVFADGPSIQGTYLLESRVLPGGAKQTPPTIVGMLTYTKNYRNVNVSWINPDGKRLSISYIAKYRLTQTVYQETPIYWMSNNFNGQCVSYKVPAFKGTENAVTMMDGTVSFPLAGKSPVVVFTADGMTATARTNQGKLIYEDHWKKVE
jgi:hypothetical protein